MKVIDFPQGSPEWLESRAGKVTASRISDVLAKIKLGEAKTRRDYRYQIMAEILTGRAQEQGFINDEMRWGTENEPYARSAYEVAKGVMVDKAGLVIHPANDRAGASPDGLVGADGMTEIKCPKTATHIGYLTDGIVPSQYIPQMQWQMACAERDWNDFVSYDPRLPEHLQLFVCRLNRDDGKIREMEAEVAVFLREVDALVVKLKDLKGA